MLASDPAALNGPLTTWIPRVLFLLLPLYALLLALFYVRQRKKFYLVDHFVFSLNFHTFAFALLTIAVFAAQVFDADLVAWFTSLGLLAVYGFIALKRLLRAELVLDGGQIHLHQLRLRHVSSWPRVGAGNRRGGSEV